MAIPNVRVNLNEVYNGNNLLVPFIPAVILKTKSGPIGTVERVNNESQFKAIFGDSDTTVPAAYALQQYLKLYQYAYVTRVANDNEAEYGTSEINFLSDKEILSTLASIPEQGDSWLGKNISELVSEDTKILSDGSVKGTLKHVTGFTEFNSTVEEEQEGYYIPFTLKTTGEKMTFKKNGVVTKEDIPFDSQIIFRTTPTDKWEVLVDGNSYITLNFNMCAFEEIGGPAITQQTIKLLSVSTNYKTDLENGKSVSLVVDSVNNKIYIDLTNVVGRNTTSIKEDINLGTLKAAEYDESGNLIGGLEYILNKLVASANAITNSTIKFTNEFTNKMDTDAVPSIEEFSAGFTGYISGGNSGNSIDVEPTDILDLIDLYNYQDYPIDEMVIPDYRQAEVVNYAVEKGAQNYYRVIANATGNTNLDRQTSVQNYSQDSLGRLEIYAPDVQYADYVDADGNPINCPASVAVLCAYANANRQNNWCSIAGINRGVLAQVTGLSSRLTKSEQDELYDADIPINTINYISSVGYVVWGNKTTADNTTTRIFDRVNVARLMQYLNRQFITVGWEYLFEPITLSLFTKFKANLEGICQTVEDNEGIDDYAVICNSSNNTDETIAANELHAEIQIKPTESLEYIIINLTGTDQITLNVNEGGAE